LVRAWQAGDELYAEVATASAPAGFVVDPALLDAAFHAALAAAEPGGPVELPFSFTDVVAHARRPVAPGARLRARLVRRGPGECSLQLSDPAGMPIVQIGAVRARPVANVRWTAAAGGARLYRMDWVDAGALAAAEPAPRRWAVLGDAGAELFDRGSLDHHADLDALRAALDRGEPAPDVVIAACTASAAGEVTPRVVVDATARALRWVQAWIGEPRLADATVAFVTQGAVPVAPGEPAGDLAHAALWGLIRTAQLEHPERSILLVDVDEHGASIGALAGALRDAVAAREPQLLLRAGRVRFARLMPASLAEPAARPLDPAGTVLVTGGTGTLGALVARHLVIRHGVRHVVLASRRGPSAEGAEALAGELASLGAAARVVACDVADRGELARVLASIPAAHPLTAIVHAAGVIDDGVLLAQTPERLERVMRAKLAGALHLDELTRGIELAAFVVFSSLAGVLGSAGQASYAAANCALDAIASRRRARGLAGLSLAWGYWAPPSGMTAHLTDADRARMASHGVPALSPEDGLALFDEALAARAGSAAVLVPVRLDLDALRARGHGGVPALRQLARPAERPASAPPPAPRRDLARLPPERRERAVLDIVCAEIAGVFGFAAPSAIEPRRPLQELGLDS
ncbi:MAG TPA: beta-ketoacyl reductase, partial [Kofleriaceae bacterium]|nr:beta-ketoacyl reductase [Kofleriaceae bacterium]